MKRSLCVTAAAAAALALIGLVQATSASALSGSETLGCRISPGYVTTFNPNCNNDKGTSGRYTVAFKVQNETGTSTYTWHVPAAYQSQIAAGCTSTNNSCTLSVANSDQNIDLSVTLTQSMATETLYSSAVLTTFCGSQAC